MILFAIAIVIRLVLMMFTYHQDLSGQILSTHFFAFNGVTNIYEYLSSLPVNHPLVKNFGVADIFIYPPLSYFTLGTYLKLISPLIPEKFYIDHMNGLNMHALGAPFHLFWFKLPYLLIDLLLAHTLTKFFKDITTKKKIFFLWLFNPVTLYTTFSMGVFDIIPVLFTVYAALFAKNGRANLAALMLGIGASFKSYPLFLLPLLVVTVPGFVSKIKTSLIGITPFFLAILPFLTSSAFKYMVFGAKSQKMFYMVWSVSGAEGIFPYLLLFTLLLLITSRAILLKDIWKSFLIYFLVLFSVTHYHPQWFLWLSPFLVLEIVYSKLKNLYLVLGLLLCYIAIVVTFDRSLSSNLLAVTFPQVEQFPGIDKVLSQKIDLNMFRSSIRSIFAGISLFLSYDLLRKKSEV